MSLFSPRYILHRDDITGDYTLFKYPNVSSIITKAKRLRTVPRSSFRMLQRKNLLTSRAPASGFEIKFN